MSLELALRLSEILLGERKVQCKDHTKERRVVVQRCAEIILPQGATTSTNHFVLTKEPAEDKVEEIAIQVPHQEDDHTHHHQLEPNAVLGVVHLREHIHSRIHQQKVECMQWTDIIQNVRVAMSPHQEQHCKVQSPHHLHHT